MNDSDITLARKINSLQEPEGASSHIFWSTKPVEWSPIGEENADSMPFTASEYLSSKSPLPETLQDTSSLPAIPALNTETDRAEKAPDLWLKKLLPLLVVILLLIGLLAALLSYFFLPGPPGSANTGKEQLVIEVRLTTVNISKQPI